MSNKYVDLYKVLNVGSILNDNDRNILIKYFLDEYDGELIGQQIQFFDPEEVDSADCIDPEHKVLVNNIIKKYADTEEKVFLDFREIFD